MTLTRDTQVSVRFDPDELAFLESCAKLWGLPLATYIRQAVYLHSIGNVQRALDMSRADLAIEESRRDA
jgi:hypothetical protein